MKTPSRKLEVIVILLTSIMVTVNLFYLVLNAVIRLKDKNTYLYEPGYQFTGIKSRILGIKKVGYLTNRNMSSEKNDPEFLQAQYMLAPTILDLNNAEHKFIILDYTDLKYMYYQMKTLNAMPLFDQFGKVLVIRKIND